MAAAGRMEKSNVANFVGPEHHQLSDGGLLNVVWPEANEGAVRVGGVLRLVAQFHLQHESQGAEPGVVEQQALAGLRYFGEQIGVGHIGCSGRWSNFGSAPLSWAVYSAHSRVKWLTSASHRKRGPSKRGVSCIQVQSRMMVNVRAALAIPAIAEAA